MSPKRLSLPLSLVALAVFAPITGASPSNDGRDHARALGALPLTVTGTTDGATAQKGETSSPCAPDTGSVWYRINPRRTTRIVARLQADGDLDATLTVYERLRSQQTFQTCDVSDTHGRAAIGFTARRGHSYLVRVARRHGSIAGSFSLDLAPAPATRLPGPALPDGGVAGTLDRVARVAQPWSVDLRAGVRYRIALERTGANCLSASLYAPRAFQRGRTPIQHLTCDHDYALVTPHAGHSGRYTIMVRARGDVRGPQRYHLQVATAGRDDSAPGVLIGNHVRVGGRLDGGGVDIVDLYRFNVTSTSKLFLDLRARGRSHFNLMLLDPLGNILRCACDGHGDQFLVHVLHRGNYYIGVRAKDSTSGTYRLVRASRLLTVDHLHPSATVLAPGATETYTVTISPAVSGPVVLSIEQLDPLAGWQFVRTLHAEALDGQATLSFRPPSVGHWRATARYEGTVDNAASHTGFHSLIVINPRVG